MKDKISISSQITYSSDASIDNNINLNKDNDNQKDKVSISSNLTSLHTIESKQEDKLYNELNKYLNSDLIDEIDDNSISKFYNKKEEKININFDLNCPEFIPSKYKCLNQNCLLNDNIQGKTKFVVRKGDWKCFICGNINFAFRKKCNKCKARKDFIEKNMNNENENKYIKKFSPINNCNNICNYPFYSYNPCFIGNFTRPLFSRNDIETC